MAPVVCDELLAAATDPAVAVEVEQRPYRSTDVAGQRLVITATDSRDVNATVRADGEAAGIWVNAADDPPSCDFTLPAVLRRAPLLVTVSTGGSSPALAAWLRDRIAADFGSDVDTLLQLVAEARADVLAQGRSSEGLDWRSALDSGMLDLIRIGRISEARERLQACLS